MGELKRLALVPETEPPFEVPPNPIAEKLGSEAEQAQFVADVREAVRAGRRELRSASRSKKWRSPSWGLVRRLRSHLKLRELTAEEAFEPVDWAIGVAFEQDKLEFPWAVLVGDSDSDGYPADPEADFIDAWDKVKGMEAGELAQAVEHARANLRPSDHFGAKLASQRWAGLRLFLTVAERLQELAGDQPIPLAVEPLGELLGVGPNTVCTYRRLGQRYRLLEQTSKARPGRAAEFRFLVST